MEKPVIIFGSTGIAKAALEIFYLLHKWRYITDPIESCRHGAMIYYKAVRSFGGFAYDKKELPAYCSESCVKPLGRPY